MWRAALAVTTFTLIIPVAPLAHAQQVPPQSFSSQLVAGTLQPTPTVWPNQARQDQGSLAGAILLGGLLGAGGFAAGALIGSAASDECEHADALCIEAAAFFGAAGGGTFGMALGVHLGNRRQGNLALDFLTAAAVWGAGIFAAILADSDRADVAILIAIPIVQLGATVAVERAAGR